MSILPMMTARAVMQKLLRAGFTYVGTRGSHYYFKHYLKGLITSVPKHGGKDVGRGLLTQIIKQAGLTVKEFLDL
jgi:mRNA interferase HicA